MFLETVRSPGLAHLSYLLGAGREAVVVDPRRDMEVYLDIARRESVRIKYIVETHRNEDLLVGSRELSELTGAPIFHGDAIDFEYGTPMADGEELRVGDLRLVCRHTPGHTDESLSLAFFHEETSGDDALGVFTGDALFVGDVGRTDLSPERAEEVAGQLFDSLFGKLLSLGDQAVVYPAHGAGSVCGMTMASRDFTTIGYERRNNPMLQLERAAFIRAKLEEEHPQPPYFVEMERRNVEGAEPVGRLPPLSGLSVQDVESAMRSGAVVLDVRSPEAFAGTHIPGSLAMPLDLISPYAGWLLDAEARLVLVAERPDDAETARRRLLRMGYERVGGSLEGGVPAWEASGRELGHIPVVSALEVKRQLEEGSATLLDVRRGPELASGRLPGAKHVFVGELPRRLAEVPRARPVIVHCSSGRRSLVAASILRRAGIEGVENFFGSMPACQAVGCPMESPG